MIGVMTLTFVTPVYAVDGAAKTNEFKAPVIVRPGLLPGPDKDQVQEEGSRKILTESVLPKFAINLISLIGAIALLFVVIGGVRYTMVYNNEEAAETAKNQVLYALVGFLIALLSYTIVTIVTNIKFSNETSMNFMPTVYASAIDVDSQLLPTPGDEYDGAEDNGDAKHYDELSAVENLPQVDESILIQTIIKTILGAASLLTIIAIVVAGIYYLIARGEEEKATKAKGILTYLVVGMVIIAAAYAVVSGVAQFDFLGQ